MDYLTWLLYISLAFALAERLRPARRGQGPLRKQLLNDGFYLLRLYDGIAATFFAASLNAGVAVIAVSISSRARFGAADASKLTLPSLANHRTVYLVIALSGLTALGAQVVWTRSLAW